MVIDKDKIYEIGMTGEGDFIKDREFEFEFKEPNFDDIDPDRQNAKIGEVGFFEKDANEGAEKLVKQAKELNSFERDKLREQGQIDAKTDMDYFFTVVFLSNKHRDEFLNKTGLLTWSESGNIDGHRLAEVFGISLETPLPPMMKLFRRNKNFT